MTPVTMSVTWFSVLAGRFLLGGSPSAQRLNGQRGQTDAPCFWTGLTGLCFLLAFAGVFEQDLQAAEEPAAAERQQQVDFFEASVRPLLLKECSGCHGDKKQWAGLRVDSLAALLKGGETGPAIIKGQPETSLLMQAVRRESLEMPPEKPLSKDQIAILDRWIREGAVWPTPSANEIAQKSDGRAHWAFQPVASHPLPVVETTWCQTPIDQFIFEKLQQAGLQPAPEADRRTLIRRLTYDLTGLPPTPEEVQAFENDRDPQAYARLVDRLLESPHYGEQWARHWLDVARYSDTKGYVYAREERFLVQAAAYRDWVVRAFQQDLPYDRFLLLQLAADQASDQKTDLAAMGYLTIGRRFLGVTHDIIDDRIDVVTRGMMGLTVGCARCHDHKYDPIPTADYYSLYGVFQNVTERLTQLEEPAERSEAYQQFEAELHKRQKALAEKHAASREEATRRVRERIVEYLVAQTELEKYPEEGFDQVLAVTDVIPTFVRRWQSYLANSTEQHDPTFVHWSRLSSLPAETFATEAVGVCQTLQSLPPDQVNPLVTAKFVQHPVSLKEVAERYGQLFTEIDTQWKALQATATTGNTSLASGLADPNAEALRQALYGPDSPCLVPDEQIVTTEYFFDTATLSELWRLQSEVDRWIVNSPQSPAFGVAVIDRQQIREPRIFRRGNPKTPGQQIPRHFLSALSSEAPPAFQQGSGRLELAKDIIAPENPLTARVWVNRVWMQHFGSGLVTTPSDFGIRATPPSHPELLDWLARTFIKEGWSTKSLHRKILLSATYRQQSTMPADPALTAVAQQIDPQNRLLWRMNSRRLPFEELRDTLLAVSGDLDPKMGGKATDMLATTHHRRTLYGLVDRQFVPGVLRIFDFANPDLHTPQRSETTVPQQALFFLNHPFMAKRAESLAKLGADLPPGARLNQLFQRLYQRPATPDEQATALAFIATAETEVAPEQPANQRAWQYGYAAINVEQQQLQNFQPLPHFTGADWQGGSSYPDAALGWLKLTPQGGHPGNDLQHAVVRRWTADRAGTVTVESLVKHEPAAGDGIRCWVISSRHGVLKTLNIHQREERLDLPAMVVEPGDTIDFVVDILEQLNSDQYLWSPTIRLANAEGQGEARVWSAEKDFGGPAVLLNPWEQLAQILLASNELMFVD